MGKKLFMLIAVALLLTAGSFNLLPHIKANTASIKITEDVVNVREQPGTSYPVITQIRKGETYQVENHQDGWYEIKLSTGQNGWVADWLAVKQSEVSSTSQAVVTVDNLNVRQKPDLSSAILGKLNKGTTVQIVSETNGWVQITFKGNQAWVSSDFIEKTIVEASTSSAVPSEKNHVKILHDGTNIRKKPELKSKIIETASSGDVFRMLEKDGDWFEIEYSSGKKGYVASWIVSLTGEPANVDISKSGIKGKTIVIDPGHGGRDQGAAGVYGTLEKELTLKTAELLESKLQAAGANVVVTRNGDQYVSLQDRSATAFINEADVFISLHYDSVEDPSIHGHTTYYYHSYEKKLAETIHKHVEKAVPLKDRGPRFGDYYVIRENSRPAVLLELGYMSNPSEEGVIKTKKYRETAATAIYEGLVDYFSN